MAGGWIKGGHVSKEPDGICKSCSRRSNWIIDGRVKFGELGPKGHWVFMCPLCHMLFGLGYGKDDLVVYKRFVGRYVEVEEHPPTTIQDIKEGVAYWLSKGLIETAQTTLLGQITIQLIQLNDRVLRILEHLTTQEVERPRIKPGTAETVADAIGDGLEPKNL